MQVKVEILPWLSTQMRPGTTGRISLEHGLAGSTMRDLLEELASADPVFAQMIYDRQSRELRYPALVVVNDQLLDLLQGLDTPLSAGDAVTFMATYVGG